MIIGLASPGVATTIDDGLDRIKRLLSEASAQGAEVVCFPEAYLPGLRGQDFEVPPFDRAAGAALEAVAQMARTYAVTTILGMRTLPRRPDRAFVIDAHGRQGRQTRMVDPERGSLYAGRHTPDLRGQRDCPAAICHEGWRYPETVRWAAVRGAKIVFIPTRRGEAAGVRLTEWGPRVRRTTRRR
jgi:predicted amidohydrolase